MKKLSEFTCENEHHFFLAILPMPVLQFVELTKTICCPLCQSEEIFIVARKPDNG